MKIIFSGGGTLGPVTPLLNVYEVYKAHRPDTEFVWVGTKHGPEREIVERYGIPFFIIGAGKWRRYFSWSNLFDVLRIILAFFQSLLLLSQERPSIVISAGGFVSVPLHIAAALLGIPAWIHQQDARPGLATKLMAPFAGKITTALAQSVPYFSAKKTEWIGNPSRDVSCKDLSVAREFFGFKEGERVIFALGGGTGSVTINQMMLEALPSWPKEWQIIHLTGRERPGDLAERAAKTFPNYHVYKFFTHEMAWAYALADVVIARAGFATLTELASLKKTAVIIPMSDTHQDENADFLAQAGAIVRLHEKLDSGLRLAREIKTLMENAPLRDQLGEKLFTILPRARNQKLIEIIETLVRQR